MSAITAAIISLIIIITIGALTWWKGPDVIFIGITALILWGMVWALLMVLFGDMR